jgi:hypothetical protein
MLLKNGNTGLCVLYAIQKVNGTNGRQKNINESKSVTGAIRIRFLIIIYTPTKIIGIIAVIFVYLSANAIPSKKEL